MEGAGFETPVVQGLAHPAGQEANTLRIAARSRSVTLSPHLAFTTTWCSTSSHRPATVSGSQSAAVASDFEVFAGPSTASRFAGSLANAVR